MFSECMSFLIREDGVTVVGSAEDADIRLAGDDVLPRHAVINFGPGELACCRGFGRATPLGGVEVNSDIVQGFNSPAGSNQYPRIPTSPTLYPANDHSLRCARRLRCWHPFNLSHLPSFEIWNVRRAATVRAVFSTSWPHTREGRAPPRAVSLFHENLVNPAVGVARFFSHVITIVFFVSCT